VNVAAIVALLKSKKSSKTKQAEQAPGEAVVFLALDGLVIGHRIVLDHVTNGDGIRLDGVRGTA
jgi:hypothetical protein